MRFFLVLLVLVLTGCGVHKVAPSCVDINHASVYELQRIVHVDSGIVDDLIAGRPFYKVTHMVLIPGITVYEMGNILEQGLACVVEKETYERY